MKRKTWIILGGAYLALVVVILVVALLVKDESPTLEPTGTTVAEISTPAPTQALPEAATEAVEDAYPLVAEMSTNVNLIQTGYPDIDEVMTATQAVSGNAPTLTRTPTSSGAVVSTQMPTATSGAGASPVPTSTCTATPTHTSAPQTGWEGEWVAYLEQSDGSFLDGQLIITRSGDEITGTLDLPSETITITGEVSTNESLVYGDYQRNTESGSFVWLWVDDELFRGSIDNQFALCGARTEADLPEQCAYFIDY